MLRSLWQLQAVDAGIRTDRVLSMRVALNFSKYTTPPLRAQFLTALADRLRDLPGVRSAGGAGTFPMNDGGSFLAGVRVQGQPEVEAARLPRAEIQSATAGYFQTVGIPLIRGRLIEDRDLAERESVAVISDSMARQFFADADPVGKRISTDNGQRWITIVGVVGDVRSDALDVTPRPTMYAPFGPDAFGTMWIVASTDGDPAQLTPLARQALREIDPALPAYSIAPLAAAVSDSVAQRRFSMLLLAAFAGVALFLAAVGIYGVVAYGVTQRTQEIGVRMAIGAERRDVLTLVIGGGLKLALLGVAIGLAGALALSRLIEAMLFDVRPFDPPSYAATAVLLLAIAALACYLPARRAMNVDPIIAIRQE
jgi:putative ABC transport system permease protein